MMSRQEERGGRSGSRGGGTGEAYKERASLILSKKCYLVTSTRNWRETEASVIFLGVYKGSAPARKSTKNWSCVPDQEAMQAEREEKRGPRRLLPKWEAYKGEGQAKEETQFSFAACVKTNRQPERKKKKPYKIN